MRGTLTIALAMLCGMVAPAAVGQTPKGSAIPLERFFAGDLSGKTIVVWGNSTVAFESAFFKTLAIHTGPGDVLAGFTVTPEIDNAEAGSATAPSRNQNGHLHSLGNIINMGNNGGTLKGMLGKPGGSLFYRIDRVCAAKPDLLIVRGPLINDVRTGACDLKCAKETQKTMLDMLEACTPRTDILLQVENSLLTTDVGNHGYVQPEAPEAAQRYSTILRESGLSFTGAYPNVSVMDLQKDLYGIQAPAQSPWMNDQLHPNEAGQTREAELVVEWLAKAKASARKP